MVEAELRPDTGLATRTTQGLPRFTLCFHGIGTPVREREPGEARYWVTRERFEEILDWAVQVPGVSLTFDDGNRSDLDVVLPALVQRCAQATFYPVVGRLGDDLSLSRAGLVELVAAGMRVGTHGQTHRPWPGLRGELAEAEILAPAKELEELLGRRVDRAAAPLGRYDRHALALLRAAGCAEISTSDQRPARTRAWLQPRFSVRADDTVSTLRDRMLVSLSPARRTRNLLAAAAKRWR